MHCSQHPQHTRLPTPVRPGNCTGNDVHGLVNVHPPGSKRGAHGACVSRPLAGTDCTTSHLNNLYNSSYGMSTHPRAVMRDQANSAPTHTHDCADRGSVALRCHSFPEFSHDWRQRRHLPYRHLSHHLHRHLAHWHLVQLHHDRQQQPHRYLPGTGTTLRQRNLRQHHLCQHHLYRHHAHRQNLRCHLDRRSANSPSPLILPSPPPPPSSPPPSLARPSTPLSPTLRST